VYYTQFSWEEVSELVAYLGVDDVFDFYVWQRLPSDH